jgi:peptidyl-prolyl cis-trans isomerase D
MIKGNKNFFDENGNFERIKYEKFLLENNQSAPQFELRLKKRELQKKLFDYIGAGTVSPQFLVKKLYEEENKGIEIDFIDLKTFYRNKDSFTENEISKFVEENKDQLKVEYLDFDYAIINPKNIIGVDEFNQSFFDKIDQIEIDIANGIQFETIINNLDITSIKKVNFRFSSNENEIEKKIYESKENNFDLFENDDNYILYNIKKIYEKDPNLNDNQIKEEIKELIYQKEKFDFNRKLLEKINDKKFDNNEFLKLGKNKIESIKLNSIKDNKKFEINAVEILYSLPINSFTLINDEKNNIYLAKVKNFETILLTDNKDKFENYVKKHNSNIKNSMLK